MNEGLKGSTLTPSGAHRKSAFADTARPRRGTLGGTPLRPSFIRWHTGTGVVTVNLQTDAFAPDLKSEHHDKTYRFNKKINSP